MIAFVLIFAIVLGFAGTRLIINGLDTGRTYDIVIGAATILVGCAQGVLYSL